MFIPMLGDVALHFCYWGEDYEIATGFNAGVSQNQLIEKRQSCLSQIKPDFGRSLSFPTIRHLFFFSRLPSEIIRLRQIIRQHATERKNHATPHTVSFNHTRFQHFYCSCKRWQHHWPTPRSLPRQLLPRGECRLARQHDDSKR